MKKIFLLTLTTLFFMTPLISLNKQLLIVNNDDIVEQLKFDFYNTNIETIQKEKIKEEQSSFLINNTSIVYGFNASNITTSSVDLNITGNRPNTPGNENNTRPGDPYIPTCGSVSYTMVGLGLNNPDLSNGTRTINGLNISSTYTVTRHYTELRRTNFGDDYHSEIWLCYSYTQQGTFDTLSSNDKEVFDLVIVPDIHSAKATFYFKQNNASNNLLRISNRKEGAPIVWTNYYAQEGLNSYLISNLESNIDYIFEIEEIEIRKYTTLPDLIPAIFEFTNNDFLGRDWALFEYKYIKNDDDGKILYKNYLKNDNSEEIEWILWREYSDGNETTDFWFNDGYDLKPNKDYVLELALNSNGDGLIKKEYKTQGKDSVLERNNDDHIFQTEAALGFKLTLNDGDGYIDYKYGLLNQEIENSEWIRLNPNSPYEVDTEGHIILYNLIPNTEYVLWISCDDGETHNSFSFSTLPLGSNIEFNGDINLVGNMAIVPIKLILNNGNGLIEYKYIPANWSDDSSNWIYWNTYSNDYNFSITLQDLLPKTEYRVLIRVDGISQITQTFTSR